MRYSQAIYISLNLNQISSCAQIKNKIFVQLKLKKLFARKFNIKNFKILRLTQIKLRGIVFLTF